MANVNDLQVGNEMPRIPTAVKNLWPWFVFGAPLVGGAIDAFLVNSKGNGVIESNGSWLSHAPISVNILAMAIWLLLIWLEISQTDRKDHLSRMIIWIILAPLYQSFSWWTTALVSSVINISLGFGLADCQADVVKAQVEQLFDRAAAKSDNSGATAAGVNDAREQLTTNNLRLCTAKLSTTGSQSYFVRYKIEDHGSSLFKNTLHGLNVTMIVQQAPVETSP
jgi:hypothetical protein